jgi:membrane peptidoglycan carboxypeptidase
VADALRDRLGVGAGPRTRASQAPRARRGQRSGAAGEDRYDSYRDAAGYRRTPEPDWDQGAGSRSRSGGGRSVPGHRQDNIRRGGDGPGRAGGDGPGGSGGGGKGWREWLLRGSWWRHWTWTKAIAIVAGGFAAVVLLLIAAFFYGYHSTQVPTDASELALQQSSTVYFSNGKTVGTFSDNGVERELLTSQQIPADMKNAVVAAEDRQFYTEGGVSITGTMRAAYEDLFGSGGLQGASTITEQFVKNYYLSIGSSGTPVKTKIKEIFVSIKLSHEKSKDWILTNYLNTVPFGDNAYGVGAAAQAYFREPASKLTVPQAAMLAAMINQPGYFNPDPHAGQPYTALVARWEYVLGNMVRDDALTQQQMTAICGTCQGTAGVKFPKIFTGQVTNGWTGYRGYIMQMVQQELESTYGYSQPKIDTSGLKIHTTFSESMMSALASAVSQDKQQMAADGVPFPTYDHIGAVLEQPGTGAILAVYGGPGYGVRHCRKLDCEYNMAEDSNEVGSSFKPYVLATAVQQGMDVQNSILNGYSPLYIPQLPADRMVLSSRTRPADMYGYWESDSDSNRGPISVTTAAAQSSDPAFTDLTHRVGVDNVIAMAKSFGVGQNPFNLAPWNDYTRLNQIFGPCGGGHGEMKCGQGDNASGSVTIALGAGYLTPVEQATTFATLADDGTYYTPHVIARLYQGSTRIPLKIVQKQVLTASQAADVDQALSQDTVDGTAYPNATWNRPVIAKTGTLGNVATASEAWFIGAIPQYSLALGMFTSTQSEDLDNLPSVGGIGGSYGGAWPATIWKTFMSSEFNTLNVQQLPTPDYIGFTKWDQVPAAARKKHPNPNPNPHPHPSCPPTFGQPCPNPSPSPTPSCPPASGQPCPNPTPTPTPTPCVPSPRNPCKPQQPPGPGNVLAAAPRSQAADEPHQAVAKPRGSPVPRSGSG